MNGGSSMKALLALVAIMGALALYANGESPRAHRVPQEPHAVANQAMGWQSAVPGLAVGP
jgi:hypothetical protein